MDRPFLLEVFITHSMLRLLHEIIVVLRGMAHLLRGFVHDGAGGAHGILGLALHAFDIVRGSGRFHHAFGEAAQRAHHAHALAGIILQEIAQPFLLHPDQPRNALATLQLVQRAAIALQPQIGEEQAFVLGKDAHVLGQLAMALGRLGHRLAELGNDMVGIWRIGHGEGSFGLGGAKQAANAGSVRCAQNGFMTRAWGVSDSFATPEPYVAGAKRNGRDPIKAPGILQFLAILPDFCAPL